MMSRSKNSKFVFSIVFSAVLFTVTACAVTTTEPVAAPPVTGNASGELFDLNTGLETRSISFENPTGERGAGGQVASPLGVGRKGAPARALQPGEEVLLADIKGNGTIRHIWMTTFPNPITLRGAVIRVYWDGQDHPSIEAPLGDFFGFAHGATPAFQSAIHSVGEAVGMNIWLPMPFTRGMRMTFTNETPVLMPLFYQIDYTLGDNHSDDVGRLHVLFQRQNPTTAGVDFELMPERRGKGRFIGTVIGVRPLAPSWWGEGEFKFYRDGDTTFPTIAGTGAEDYVGLSWGLQPTPFLYHGSTYRETDNPSETGSISMYRWHIKDPVLWETSGRATIQQIGHKPGPEPPTTIAGYLINLFEREDDWSAASFWYEAIPSAPLPPMPDFQARTADLVIATGQ
jgi:hypothetical protein